MPQSPDRPKSRDRARRRLSGCVQDGDARRARLGASGCRGGSLNRAQRRPTVAPRREEPRPRSAPAPVLTSLEIQAPVCGLVVAPSSTAKGLRNTISTYTVVRLMATSDFFDELGPVGMGSRTKRLGERIFGEAAESYAELGYDFEARWFPLTNLLARQGSIAVSEAARRLGVSQPAISQFAAQLEDAGLVEFVADERDGRRRVLTLSPVGAELVSELEPVWAAFQEAAIELCMEAGVDFPAALRRIETALDRASLGDRVRAEISRGVRIVNYHRDLREHFATINLEWLSQMFEVEEIDRQVLDDPETHILGPGGQIWFATTAELGVVGTCALIKAKTGVYELSKMGVRTRARGQKIGEKLLRRVIFEAYRMQPQQLYLLTNKRCQAAIHLYEKHGFEHCSEIMDRFGGSYRRCDVAMVHRRTNGLAPKRPESSSDQLKP
ncbi:MAG: GNAT family N-acetyltransferase [Myxococcales bacterium FL481]|nr:MAG: GNAT family N-acetyltransferase [Myxococcales bacterium FL481]